MVYMEVLWLDHRSLEARLQTQLLHKRNNIPAPFLLLLVGTPSQIIL